MRAKEQFRNWLNVIDARIGYTGRCEAGTVVIWRTYFDVGYSEFEAIKELTGLYRPEIVD